MILGAFYILLFTTVGICKSITEDRDITVLFQNDGNWTTHADNPSAILVLSPSSHRDAVDTCASYGEELLDCKYFSEFYHQLQYQVYLGKVEQTQTIWSSCSMSPFTLDGAASHMKDSIELPFICTNSAPTVTKVDTDFSTFSRINITSNGTIFEGLHDHMAFRFMEIPFAKPPTGALRFQYAQPWNGTYVDATKYGPACLQYGRLNGNQQGFNPWPKLKPVLFWIHGGAFTHRSAVDGVFDGASLVSRGDVVLVTVNYRLSIFGFLALNDTTVTGNYDMSDKIEALKWVQNHISAFGGDPNNVTIFGQSAGGSAVISLIQSQKAAGLFTGAIAQSAGGSYATPSAATTQILPFIDNLCPNATGEVQTNVTSWTSVVDVIYFEDMSIAQLAKGRQYVNKVKFMAGYMPNEYQSLIAEALPPNITSLEAGLKIMQHPVSPTERTSMGNSSSQYSFNNAYNATVNVATNAFLTGPGIQVARIGAASYSFDRMWIYKMERGYALSYLNPWGMCSFPVGRPEVPYYKCHSSDLYEVFGTYYLSDQPIRVDDDVYYTNAIQDMWASFARTGNLNVDKSYLIARGYNSTLEFFSNFVWPSFTAIAP
ncbi:Carboxylesterase, type B [Penicillium expansum]|uniref:Carboxylic ester hydrolase n=1 Tax=Penicillium expansum TaxID=27334 RepID=A0A0A2J6G1_PENEN|nr:Carboxylesterase, type B [Penicillium expansum]KGO50346.1 Carboxylesterase, type B [Penicillium expansum]